MQEGNDGDEGSYQEEVTEVGFKVTWSRSLVLPPAKYMIDQFVFL